MFRDYFVFEGKKYYTGTVVKTANVYRMPEVTFVCCEEKWNQYRFRDKKGCGLIVPESRMKDTIIAVTDQVDTSVRMPEIRKKRDAHIDGLFYAWVWYIFLMVVSTIFYDRIMMWIIFSVAFFVYRAIKIEEGGTYIKW